MFPWERHQMDGSGSLKWFDKLYWGLFVSAMAVLLFTNLARNTKKEDTEEQKQVIVIASLLLRCTVRTVFIVLTKAC